MDTISSCPQDNNPPTKTCSGPCGRTLPATPEFWNRNKNGKYGLKSYCKQCQSEKGKAYRSEHTEDQKRYYEAHREEKLRYAAEYRSQHKEERNQYNAKYSMEHREEIKAQRKKRYAENRDEQRERNLKNYAKNAEARRAYAAKYRNEHQEQVKLYRDNHRSEHRQYDKAHYLKHRERKRLYNALYRKNNYDEIRKKQIIYWKSEQGRIVSRVQAHRRRALKRNAKGNHTAEELYQQLLRQRNKCYYCRVRLDKGRESWHADHVIPLTRGGSNDISNIVIACPTCNMRKHNKLLHEWLDGGRLC